MPEQNVFADLLAKLQETLASMNPEDAAQLVRGGEERAFENASGAVVLPVAEGELYSLQELIGARFANASHDGLFLIRDGSNLKVRLADNGEFVLQDFFVVCADGQCAIELPSEEGKDGVIIDGDAEGEIALEDGTTLLGYSGDPEAVMAMLQMDPVLAPFVDALSIEGLADSQAPMAVGQLGEASPEEHLSQDEGSGDESGLSWGMVAGMLGGVGLAAAAASSGGGSSSSNETPADPADPQDPAVTTEFDVGTMLGPAVNGNDLYVGIYDGSGNRLAGDVKLADNGLAHVVIEGEYSGPVLLRLFDSDDSQPDYLDEATQTARDLGDSLHAAIWLDGTVETVYITPLTDIAVRYMGGNLDDADAIAAANTAVGRFFGQQAGLLTEEPMPVVDTEGNIDLAASNLYGQVLALLSTAEANNTLSVHELLDQLEAGLEYDGERLSWKDEEAGWVAQQTLFEAVEQGANDGIIDKQVEIEQLFVLPEAGDHVVTIRRHGDTPRDAVAPSGADVQITEITDELRFTLNVRTPDGTEVNLEEVYESGPQSDITEATHTALFNLIAADLALDNLTLTSIDLSQGATGTMTLTVTPMDGVANGTASLSVVGEGLASNTYGMRVLAVSQLGPDEVASLSIPVLEMIDAGPGLGLLNRDAVREGLTAEQYDALSQAQRDALPKPATPTLSITDAGILADDGVTNNGTVSISGIEEGNSWEYTIDGQTWQAGSGSGFTLEPGEYSTADIRVRQSDASGLTSETVIFGESVGYDNLNIDITPPEIVIDEIGTGGLLNAQDIDGLYTISIQANGAEGRMLYLDVGGSTTSGSPVGSDGAWSTQVNLANLGEGDHVITARSTDAAGNETVVTQTITIDTTPPQISIDTLADDNLLNAMEAAEGLTISGTTDAGDGQVVAVHLNDKAYTATVANGVWSLSVDAADLVDLDNTTYSVRAHVSDRAGNSATPAEQDLTVDITAPSFAASPFTDMGTKSGPFGFYLEGDILKIGVSFTEAVWLEGDANLTLTMNDGTTRQAALSDYVPGSDTMVFAYTIQQGDYHPGGVHLAAGALTLPGDSAIVNGSGNPLLASSPASNYQEFSPKVDAVKPEVESVQLRAVDDQMNALGADDVLLPGDVILVDVNFSEGVDRDTAPEPSIFIEINGQQVEAVFHDLLTTATSSTATFRYELEEGALGISGDDVSVTLADPSGLDGTLFKDLVGNRADASVVDPANSAHTPELSVDIDVAPLTLAADQLLADAANLDVRSDLLIALDSAAELGSTGVIQLQGDNGSIYRIEWSDPSELTGVVELVEQGGNHYLKINPEQDLDFNTNYGLAISDGSLVNANNGLSFGADQTLSFATVAPSTDASTPGNYSSAIELVDGNFAVVADNARWSLVDGQGNNDEGGVPTLVSHTASEDIDMYVLSAESFDSDTSTWLFSGAFVSFDDFDSLEDRFYVDVPDSVDAAGVQILNQVGNLFESPDGTDPRTTYTEVIGIATVDDQHWGFTVYNSNQSGNFESLIIFNGQAAPQDIYTSIQNATVIG